MHFITKFTKGDNLSILFLVGLFLVMFLVMADGIHDARLAEKQGHVNEEIATSEVDTVNPEVAQEQKEEDIILMQPLYNYYRNGNIEEAEKYAAILEANYLSHPEVVRQLASYYYVVDGDPDRSVALLEKVNDPQSVYYTTLIAEYLLKYNDPDKTEEALDVSNQAIKLAEETDVDPEQAYSVKAKALTMLGRAEEAIAVLEDHVLKDKAPEENLEDRLVYGYALNIAGEEDEARQVFEDILAIPEESMKSEEELTELEYAKTSAQEALNSIQ